MAADPPTTDVGELLELMFRLGQAYLACGEQTAKVELILRRIASAYGIRRCRVVAFSTAVFISLHDGSEEHVTVAEGPTQSLRLDQIGDIYHLGDAAQRGEQPPGAFLQRLNDILKQEARFGAAGTVVGHAILSVGLALVLMPALANLVAVGLLGTLVGAVKALNRNRPLLDVPLPVVASLLVSMLVFLAVGQGLPVDPRYVLVPPLVAFLPGAMLTLGMVELAYGDMVSGSSRLVTGFVQLVLLTFGLVAGAALVGYQPDQLNEAVRQPEIAHWLPWAGVLVFGAGAFLHFSAPPRSLGWMLLVLLLAFGSQQLAAVWFGNEVSGFFGMLVATPLGYLIQLRFHGPPAMVTFLPTFWLLVPGALGLVSVKTMLSDRVAGLAGLATATFVFTSIALGTLMGAALYKWLTETFGWWQLQLGRVGRYFRQK
jgi:uncharacterized membrane protein YjjP (DUF1212 family)